MNRYCANQCYVSNVLPQVVEQLFKRFDDIRYKERSIDRSHECSHLLRGCV